MRRKLTVTDLLNRVCYRLYRYVLNKVDLLCSALFGWSLYSIRPRQIIARLEALESHGVSETGESQADDIDWREPVSVLLTCWSRDKKLTALGRKLAVAGIEGIVQQRWEIQATLAKYPAIERVPVKRPVFIIGLLRTGTTLLHNLLGLDPSLKAPLLWELLYPTPPPSSSELYTDPRVQQADDDMEFFLALQPELLSIHELKASKPDECCHLLERCFIDRHAPVTGQCLGPYREWLKCRTAKDLQTAYSFYKKQLQVLGFKQDMTDRRWVLKDAAHMLNLDALFATFPDALVITTHRDPSTVLASSLSGALTISSFYYNPQDINRRQLGARELEQFRAMTDKLISFRQNPKMNERFLDLAFEQIQKNPVATVEKVYRFIGEVFTRDTERQIAEYMKDNPKHKYGKHTYKLEPYLTKTQVDRAFADYRKHFKKYL